MQGLGQPIEIHRATTDRIELPFSCVPRLTESQFQLLSRDSTLKKMICSPYPSKKEVISAFAIRLLFEREPIQSLRAHFLAWTRRGGLEYSVMGRGVVIAHLYSLHSPRDPASVLAVIRLGEGFTIDFDSQDGQLVCLLSFFVLTKDSIRRHMAIREGVVRIHRHVDLLSLSDEGLVATVKRTL